MEIVLDASAIAALYLPERYSDWVRKVVERYSVFHILDLTLYELCNMLWKRVYLLHELSPHRAEALWNRIKYFTEALCSIHRYSEVLDQALEISVRYGITAYDASYLALAKKLNTKLVTLDRKLGEKLKETDLRNLLEIPYM